MDIVFLIGRIIAGLYFLVMAFNHFSNAQAMSGYAASKGVPAPKLAVLGSGTLLLIGGLSLVTGVLPVVGSAALILFLVPVTLTMHQFWKVEDQMARMGEMTNFLKNTGLLGLVIMTLAQSLQANWPLSLNLF